MQRKQQPRLLAIMMCGSYQVPWIMLPPSFLKLPFFAVCSWVHVRFCICVWKRRSNRDSEGDHVQTRRGGEKKAERYIKQGGRYQPAYQVETSCGRAQKTFKEVSLTSQKAGQIRQITTLGGSISHIPECPALESGAALESQVSWLQW